MKIVFFGYRTWALTIFENLYTNKQNKHTIVGLFTTEHPELQPSEKTDNYFEINPQELSNSTEIIKKLDPKILLFYGWSWMIPQELLQNFTCIILHPSPLPKYRGGSPLQHQIINGEKESAVTLIKATDRVDAGPIYSQTNFPLAGSLSEIFQRIIEIGTEDTIKVLNAIESSSINPYAQDESIATYYKRRTPEESEITIDNLKTKPAEAIYNFIRALEDPYPNAFITCSDGKKLIIKKASIVD